MNEAESDFLAYYDLYKDAHGFRPRGQREWFISLDATERQTVLDELQEMIREQIAEEKREQAEARKAEENARKNGVGPKPKSPFEKLKE